MTGKLALILAMWVLFAASFAALWHAKTALAKRARMAPAMLVGAVGFWLADRTLTWMGVQVTSTQMPIRDYLPAFVVFWAAATIFGLVSKSHNGVKKK